MDRQAMVERQPGVAAAGIDAGRVPRQVGGESRERVRKVAEETEHLVSRQQVFHHHEAHQVETEVAGDSVRPYRDAKPAKVGSAAQLRRLVHKTSPGVQACPP